jgi:hypothetical protein
MRPSADRYTPDDTADRPRSSAGSGFAEAYRVHGPGLVKLAAFIVGDQATGEDVVQDVFTRLHQRWDIAAEPPHRMPWYRLYALRLSLVTGQPSGILYRSAASVGSHDDPGLVPVLSDDGQAQHWFLVLDPEQFGWISGGKLVPLPIKASAGLMAIGW